MKRANYDADTESTLKRQKIDDISEPFHGQGYHIIPGNQIVGELPYGSGYPGLSHYLPQAIAHAPRGEGTANKSTRSMPIPTPGIINESDQNGDIKSQKKKGNDARTSTSDMQQRTVASKTKQEQGSAAGIPNQMYYTPASAQHPHHMSNAQGQIYDIMSQNFTSVLDRDPERQQRKGVGPKGTNSSAARTKPVYLDVWVDALNQQMHNDTVSHVAQVEKGQQLPNDEIREKMRENTSAAAAGVDADQRHSHSRYTPQIDAASYWRNWMNEHFPPQHLFNYLTPPFSQGQYNSPHSGMQYGGQQQVNASMSQDGGMQQYSMEDIASVEYVPYFAPLERGGTTQTAQYQHQQTSQPRNIRQAAHQGHSNGNAANSDHSDRSDREEGRTNRSMKGSGGIKKVSESAQLDNANNVDIRVSKQIEEESEEKMGEGVNSGLEYYVEDEEVDEVVESKDESGK